MNLTHHTMPLSYVPVVMELKKARLKAGLSQSGLARLLDVNQPHVSNVERLWHKPSQDLLTRWIEALGAFYVVPPVTVTSLGLVHDEVQVEFAPPSEFEFESRSRAKPPVEVLCDICHKRPAKCAVYNKRRGFVVKSLADHPLCMCCYRRQESARKAARAPYRPMIRRAA